MGKDNLKEEEKCREIFNGYYSKKGIKLDEWENMSKKKFDPPDYYVCISGVKYAVEITSMSVKKPTVINDGYVLFKTYINSYIKLIRKVEKKALEENKLKGLYAVHFFNPIADFTISKNVQDDLKTKLVDLIKNRTVCYVSKILNTNNENIQNIVEYYF